MELTYEIQQKLFLHQCLVSRKVDLARTLAEHHARDLSAERGWDMTRHMRDGHNRHVAMDPEPYVEDSRRRRDDGDALRHEFDEVCDEIKALEAELEPILGVTVDAPAV